MSEETETRNAGENEMEEASAELPNTPSLSALGTVAVDSTTDTNRLSVPPPSSPGPVTLAFPSAAQPLRPSTPRRSKSPAAPLPPSSSSSGATIHCSTRQNSRPTIKATSDEELDENASDDSLRLMPVTSSAVKGEDSGGGGVKHRPPKSRRRRSPTTKDSEAGEEREEDASGHSRIRQKSSAPSSSSGDGANAEASSSNGTILDKDYDELDLLSSSQASRPTIKTKRKSKKRPDRRRTLDCVEIPAPSRRSSSSTRSTPRGPSLQPSTSRRTSPTTLSSSMNLLRASSEMEEAETETARKRRKKDHSFEPTSSSRHSSPRARSSSPLNSPQKPTLSALRLDTAEALPRDDPDEDLDARSGASSPLTSVAASSPTLSHHRSSTTPPVESLATKRRLSPSDTEDDKDDHDNPTGSDKESASSDTASPKKKARVRKTVSAKPKRETTSKAGKRTAGKGKKAVKEEEEKEAVPTEAEETSEEGKASVTSVEEGNGWGTRPKRKKSARQSMREANTEEDGGSSDESEDESEETDEDDSGSESVYNSSPARKPKSSAKSRAKPSPRVVAGKKGKKKEPGGKKLKSKGKGKAKEKTDDESAKPTRGPSSSPVKAAYRPTSSFLMELSQPSKSERESSQERAKGWDVREFDSYVWVHLDSNEEGRGGFWWIGKITNKLRSERPLTIELFVDPEGLILQHCPEKVVRVEEPSPDNLLKFRSPSSASKLRFNKATFRDSADSTSTTDGLEEAFGHVLQQALQLESSADSDDSDSSDALPDPSQLGKSSQLKKTSQKKREESSEGGEEEVGSDSDDDLLKERDEVSSFPFYCIAKERGGWWAASCVGYADGGNTNRAGKALTAAKRKFQIEYPTGDKSILPRSSLLFPRQKQFSTVKLQETVVEFPKQYLENATSFIKEICPEELNKTLNESYPPAQPRNDAFYAGGREREQLAKMSVFGELPSDFIEEFSETIASWLLPKSGDHPEGSHRYEALTKLERVRYIADVLLPVAIILNFVDDSGDADTTLEQQVRKAAKEAGKSDPSPEELEAAVFDLAYRQLSSQSATKAVQSMREGRKTAEAQKSLSQRSRR
ncbi:uncharacterized protein JCM6883_002090 [Sporobolomyces salmoneus]|uniref:uncharacterized protein n=1 Tax=Sporobolomyces salmoneus TaxID=183962 RepID=UPI003177A206